MAAPAEQLQVPAVDLAGLPQQFFDTQGIIRVGEQAAPQGRDSG